MNIKEKVNFILSQLIGFELTRTNRVGSMECFKFGEFLAHDQKERTFNIGQFDLHVQCSWRLTKGSVILVGDYDVFEQVDETSEYDENFNWDTIGENLRDVKLSELLNFSKYIIISVNADDFGGFEIFFNNNMKLTVFPTLSSKSFYSEYWRLIDNRENKNHFVVSPTGIEEV